MLHSLQKLQRHVVLLCLYGMLSRIVIAFVGCCVASRKRVQRYSFFSYHQTFSSFFFKKMHIFSFFQLLRILASPCNFFYQASVSFRYLVDNSNNIIGLYSLYNRTKGSLATTRVGVEYYGIKLAVAHRCFVYA